MITPGLSPGAGSFLSTLSLRRATQRSVVLGACVRDFYPRSPCGERLVRYGVVKFDIHFYPRSPCGERLTAIFPRLQPL